MQRPSFQSATNEYKKEVNAYSSSHSTKNMTPWECIDDAQISACVKIEIIKKKNGEIKTCLKVFVVRVYSI